MSSFTALRDALRDSPENVSLLLLFGRTCLDELRLDKARDAFERVLEIDPDHQDAQLGIAKVHFMEGDPSGAAVRIERVLQADPGDIAAHLLLSRVLLSEGDRTRAVEHFDKAAQLDATMSDPALEKDLERTAKEARRAAGPATPEVVTTDSFFENESSGDAFEDPFLEDVPFEWRPETFFAPGDPERTRVAFADVGGMEALKEEIRLKIIYPLQFPDLYKAYGRRTGGGILIYGPPGCGKTLMLRAVAGEVACNYFSVGLHEIFDPYWGSTERNLHQIFETVRAQAPCVLVFDELDSLAQDRRQVRETQMRNLVNQFLHELDGIRSENQRILVIGATNQPWNLDPAFRRPGRFDQTIFVPPPDDAARAQIIGLLARDKPISNLRPDVLVQATQGYSGADLKWIFDRAAELALSEVIHTGKPVPISMDRLLEVASSHHPTSGQWLEGARTHVAEMAPDGGFAEVRKFLGVPAPKES